MDELLKVARTRRRHSDEFKQAVVSASTEPGASVAGIALAHGINANLARRWMAERGEPGLGVTNPFPRPVYVAVR